MGEERPSENQSAGPSARAALWESLMKNVTALVAVIGAVVSILSALNTARINAQTAQVSAYNAFQQARRPYLDKMFALYSEIVGVTAKITTTATSGNMLDAQAVRRFWQLYSGEAALFASPGVRKQLSAFEQTFNEHDDDYTTLTKENRDAWGANLGTRSRALAQAMYDQLDAEMRSDLLTR